MMRGYFRLVQILLIAAGLGLIGFAIYSYLGPDLAFAVKQAAPASQVLPVSDAGSGAGAPLQGSTGGASSKPVPLEPPYPRGQGQTATRVVIPRMRLDQPVKEATWTTSNQKGTLYSDWVLPYDAIGHLVNTARPGEAGNMVLSGHNNLVGPNKFGVGLFAGLWDMKPGDPFYVVDQASRAYEYKVTQSYSLREEDQPMSVREQHARQILEDNGQPTATLITCWNGPVAPLSGNTYRWVVKADFVGEVDASLLPQ